MPSNGIQRLCGWKHGLNDHVRDPATIEIPLLLASPIVARWGPNLLALSIADS